MTTIANMNIMNTEDTERSTQIAVKFLADMAKSEGIQDQAAPGPAFAIGASAGQLLFVANARSWPKDEASQLGFVAGMASGFVSCLFQAIGPASADVLGAALEAGLSDGLERCTTLYGAPGHKGAC